MRIALAMVSLCLLLAPSELRAASHTIVSAYLDVSALEPGHQARLAVVLDIAKGLHAQSHTPLDPYAVKCELTLASVPGLVFGQIEYPRGKEEEFPALGKLSVYTGRVIILVTVTTTADAKSGPIKLSGSVQLQLCNSETCFAPEDDSFIVDTAVANAGTPIEAINKMLFPNPATSQPTSEPSK
jgi:hypothetical protein